MFRPEVTERLYNVCRRRFAEVGAVVIPQVNATLRPLPFKEQCPTVAINGWTAATQTIASTPAPDPSSSQRPPVNTSLSDCVGMLKGSLNRAKQRLGLQPGNYLGVSDDAKGKKAQHQGMNGDLTISPPGILDSSSIRMKQNNPGSKWATPAVEKPVHTNTDNESYAYQSVPVTQISDSSGGAPNLSSGEMLCTSGQANLGGRSKSLKRGNAEMDHVLAEPISMSDLGLYSRYTLCL